MSRKTSWAWKPTWSWSEPSRLVLLHLSMDIHVKWDHPPWVQKLVNVECCLSQCCSFTANHSISEKGSYTCFPYICSKCFWNSTTVAFFLPCIERHFKNPHKLGKWLCITPSLAFTRASISAPSLLCTLGSSACSSLGCQALGCKWLLCETGHQWV